MTGRDEPMFVASADPALQEWSLGSRDGAMFEVYCLEGLAVEIIGVDDDREAGEIERAPIVRAEYAHPERLPPPVAVGGFIRRSTDPRARRRPR